MMTRQTIDALNLAGIRDARAVMACGRYMLAGHTMADLLWAARMNPTGLLVSLGCRDTGCPDDVLQRAVGALQRADG